MDENREFTTQPMRIPLDLPRDERQRRFLDYFNSELGQRVQTGAGESGATADGGYESSHSGIFAHGDMSWNLLWRLRWRADGVLESLSVQHIGATRDDTGWQHTASTFVTSVLATTLRQPTETCVWRSTFYYIGVQLDGEYWLPGYRFAPSNPDDPQPYLVNAERVVSIDQRITAIDAQHASDLSEEVGLRHAARLSLLLNIGLYVMPSTMVWVIPSSSGVTRPEAARYDRGFTHRRVILSEMPRKGKLCPPGKYGGRLMERYRMPDELLSLPPQGRRILRGIDNAPPAVTDRFDRAARLYQVAAVCGPQFPSLGLAYRVAAVEAITQGDSAFKGFSDFVRRHVRPRDGLDFALDYLYHTVRSAHFHAGQFPLGEYDQPPFNTNPMMDALTAQKMMFDMECHQLMREAIITWLATLVPEPSTEQGDEPVSEGQAGKCG